MKWTKGLNLLSRRRSLVFPKWTKELFIRASMRFAQRLTVLAYYFFWFFIILPWSTLSTVLSKNLLRNFYGCEELIIFQPCTKQFPSLRSVTSYAQCSTLIGSAPGRHTEPVKKIELRFGNEKFRFR